MRTQTLRVHGVHPLKVKQIIHFNGVFNSFQRSFQQLSTAALTAFCFSLQSNPDSSEPDKLYE